MTGVPAVRLTFPSYDVGATDILVMGMRAGICLADNKGWKAYLYPALTDRRIRMGGEEEVTAETLGELRKVLRERVDLKGPWWQ